VEDKKVKGVWYGPWIEVPRDLVGQPDDYWTRLPTEDQLFVEVQEVVNDRFEGTYRMRVDHCHEDRRQGSVFLLGVYIKGSLRAMDEDAKKYLPGVFCLHLCGFDNEGGCKFAHDDYPTMRCKTIRRVARAARSSFGVRPIAAGSWRHWQPEWLEAPAG
jgi:hypothetical protein